MKKGICPSCQGKGNIQRRDGDRRSRGCTTAIPSRFRCFRIAALDNYVCGQCGYVESYVAKEKDLAAIRKKWPLMF